MIGVGWRGCPALLSLLRSARGAVRRAARERAARGPAAAHPAHAAHSAEAERLERAHRVEPAPRLGAPELALLELLALPQRLVARVDDQVLEHLDVLGVVRVGVDRELLQAHVAREDDLDHPAARRRVDRLLLEFLLRLLLLREHRLRFGEHLLKVGRLGHQVCSSGSGGSSSASNSSMNRCTRSSSVSFGALGAVAVSVGIGSLSERSSYASRSEDPVTDRIALTSSSLFAGSSALRLRKDEVSGHASVSPLSV